MGDPKMVEVWGGTGVHAECDCGWTTQTYPWGAFDDLVAVVDNHCAETGHVWPTPAQAAGLVSLS